MRMDTIVRRGSNSENGYGVCLFILCLKFSRVVGFFRNQRQAGMGGGAAQLHPQRVW